MYYMCIRFVLQAIDSTLAAGRNRLAADTYRLCFMNTIGRKMATTTSTSIRFTEDEEKLLQELKDSMKARTTSEVVRRSVAQSSFLQKYADDDGFVTIRQEDGTFLKLPVKLNI